MEYDTHYAVDAVENFVVTLRPGFTCLMMLLLLDRVGVEKLNLLLTSLVKWRLLNQIFALKAKIGPAWAYFFSIIDRFVSN